MDPIIENSVKKNDSANLNESPHSSARLVTLLIILVIAMLAVAAWIVFVYPKRTDIGPANVVKMYDQNASGTAVTDIDASLATDPLYTEINAISSGNNDADLSAIEAEF